MRPTDARRRLGRQLPTQFLQDQAMFGFRLRVARHHQFPPVGQRHMDVQHQDAGKGFQHRPGCQSRRVGLQPLAQGHVQTIGQKAHQNVGFDPQLDMVADGTQLQIAFERPERRLNPVNCM